MYPMALALSCFDPREMAETEKCLAKLKTVLNSLLDKNLLLEHKRDLLCVQYMTFCQQHWHDIQRATKWTSNALMPFFVHFLIIPFQCFGKLSAYCCTLAVAKHQQKEASASASKLLSKILQNYRLVSSELSAMQSKTDSFFNMPISQELKASMCLARQRYGFYMLVFT